MGHAFPSPELVGAAASMFTRRLPKWDGSEGARWRITIGPGVVQVGSVDAARAERGHERERHRAQVRAAIGATDLLLEDRATDSAQVLEGLDELHRAGLIGSGPVDAEGDWYGHLLGRIERRDLEGEEGPSRITSWSRKSRARMVKTLAGLDYGPLLGQAGTPAMLTLTYPGEWERVAPSAKVATGHVNALKRRFLRTYGRPLIGTWKREFQRRGAPHYHILMVPPRERVNGQSFGLWVARAWADIVGAERCSDAAAECGRACEYHRHLAAGTGVDYAEGMRARDPKRLAVYFSKHGVYAAKDYQNEAPGSWVEAGSVGRFWGVWGLEAALSVVELLPADALAVARTMRRWQRANGFRAQRTVWRTDTRTGELKSRRSGVWVGSRMRGARGFVVVNDGPAFASALARYLDSRGVPLGDGREDCAATLAQVGPLDALVGFSDAPQGARPDLAERASAEVAAE